MDDLNPEPGASPLRGLDIVDAVVEGDGDDARQAAIITCWCIAAPGDNGPNPRVDLVLRNVPIHTGREDRCTILTTGRTLSSQIGLLDRIYLLFDRYAQGNEPPPQVEWDDETRDKAAQVGLMACLAMLLRTPSIKARLVDDPSVLVVGLLDTTSVMILEGENEKMIRFALSRLPDEG